VSTTRAPLAPRGCPSAISPPFGFTCSGVVGRPESAQDRQRLSRERIVELDDVEVTDRPAGPVEDLCGSPAAGWLNGRGFLFGRPAPEDEALRLACA